MFSKEETKELISLFWTSYGKYMNKHHSKYSKNIKWVNYRTNVKGVFLRLRATKKQAEICIELQHKNDDIRYLFYEQFMELKTVFTSAAGEWIWEKDIYNENEIQISKIYLQLDNVNIFNKNTWQDSFYFFEKHILAFDEFWADFSEVVKQLED